ncbi:MAG: cohesin domain-containing protein [Candidatus Paceibacterota bacterium]
MLNLKTQIYKLSSLSFLFALFFVPLIANGQAVSLTSARTTYPEGSSILVSLSIDTAGRSINAISGTVSAPVSNLSIQDVRYGSSIISLWVAQPTINSASGSINFTGGTPGGFSGAAGPILSFNVLAKSVGTYTVSVKDLNILLNDGQGTELTGVKINPLTLTIEKRKEVAAPAVTAPVVPSTKETSKPSVKPKTTLEKPITETQPQDILPPDPIISSINREPTIENNKYFAVFFAVDKDSGVSYYEVKEQPLLISLFTESFNTEWTRANTPYILKYQLWASNVRVRAFDQVGNMAETRSFKPFHPTLLTIFALLLVIISVASTLIVAKRRPTRRRKSAVSK